GSLVMRLAAVAMGAAIHRHKRKARRGQTAIPAGGFPILQSAGAEAMHQHNGGASALTFIGQFDAVVRGHEIGHDTFSIQPNSQTAAPMSITTACGNGCS